jgi:CheY-like chemotaxis protein
LPFVAGMNGYLSKPFKLPDLLGEVQAAASKDF